MNYFEHPEWILLQPASTSPPAAFSEPIDKPGSTYQNLFSPGKFVVQNGTGASPPPLAMGAQSRWTAAFRADEVLTLLEPMWPSTSEGSLGAIMHEFQARTAAEIQRLSADMEDLRRELAIRAPSPADIVGVTLAQAPIPINRYATVADLRGALGVNISGDAWLDLFDWAADDYVVTPPIVVEAAIEGVGSTDPAVRGAAGRVLARSGVAAHIERVVNAAAIEQNAYVRKVLESAVRAAMA